MLHEGGQTFVNYAPRVRNMHCFDGEVESRGDCCRVII